MSLTLEDKVLLKLLFKPENTKSLLMNEEDDKALPDYLPDWTNLVEQARREGVSAVLFHNITSHHLEDFVPQDRCRDLSNQYYANLKSNLLIIGELREVLATFQDAGIPCIVLKGIALAERVYPNIAMRGMSDVDILVRKMLSSKWMTICLPLDIFPRTVPWKKPFITPPVIWPVSNTGKMTRPR